MKLLIKNAKIVSSKEIIKSEILIENEKILKVERSLHESILSLNCHPQSDRGSLKPNTNINKIPAQIRNDKKGNLHKDLIDQNNNSKVEIIDANGCFAFPGFIDFHVHLDDKIGEFDIADSYATGTRVGLNNGITTMFSFVTQKKGENLTESIKQVHSKAENNLFCDMKWHLSPTSFTEKDFIEIEKAIDQGFKTFKFYTTYKKAGIYSSYDIIRNFGMRFKHKDIRLLVHCENEDHLAYQPKKKFYIQHSINRPKSAEIEAVKKILKIAIEYQIPIHFVHITTPEAVDLISKAKKKAPVSCETGMQYLFLNDSCLNRENGNYFICSPPLRDKENVNQLIQRAKKGFFDIFATDHCPFTKKSKDKYKNQLNKIPNGLPGLDFLSKLTYELLQLNNDDGMKLMAKMLCENPAKLGYIFPEKGIIKEGSIANIVILRKGEYKPLASRDNIYNPYSEIKSSLEIVEVIRHGKRVLNDQ